MNLKNLALAFAIFSTTFALPQATPITNGTPFALVTLKEGTPLQNAGIQAALRSLFVNLGSQNATCTDTVDPNFATFYLNDGELNLYGNTRQAHQKIFVDRSGMGMGKIGYITGSESLGRNWETQGWALKNGQLEFKGTGLQACPYGLEEGAWSVWLKGWEKPGYLEGCTAVGVMALETPEPIPCFYKN
jgi:hypothetical protein